ncbi:MAG TPA: cyclic nucleotide-binding domain-containing protein [Polyangiaceae bacterium]|nr:cyclic nucleotide-binding domain-containing protein [Polyangiaceae bacterium]
MTTDQFKLERELFVRALMPTMHGEGAARIAALLEARDLPEGAILFREGDPPDQFFFVVEGRVVLEAEGLPDWVFGDRSLVGMVDMNAGRPHRRTCRTTRPTRLLVGRAAAWLDIMTDDPEMGDTAIYFFALRVHERSLELGHLLEPAPIADGEIGSPLAIHQKALVLRDTALLSRASTQAIASLAQVAEEITYPAGATLFARGQAERALYAVARGVVQLRASNGRVVRVGPQCFLAPESSLCGRLGEFSAEAETACSVLRIRVEDYYDQSDEHPDLTRAAMASLALEVERLIDLKPPEG